MVISWQSLSTHWQFKDIIIIIIRVVIVAAVVIIILYIIAVVLNTCMCPSFNSVTSKPVYMYSRLLDGPPTNAHLNALLESLLPASSAAPEPLSGSIPPPSPSGSGKARLAARKRFMMDKIELE